MNEIFAAEPRCIESIGDARYLFGLFGPYTGRYIACCPECWNEQVLSHFSKCGDLEVERLKCLIRRAREQAVLLTYRSLAWDPGRSWVENAIASKRASNKMISQVILATSGQFEDALGFDHLDLPPTADEKIQSTPEEYERVCGTLLKISGEIFLVDPYLNPCKKDIRQVLKAILQKVAIGKKCQRVVCYARTSLVLGTHSYTWAEVSAAWNELLNEVKWPNHVAFEYSLLSDENSERKMHARYLFSLKGGIRLDQGFQKLPRGRTVDISPIGKALHETLLRDFLDEKNRLPIEKSLQR